MAALRLCCMNPGGGAVFSVGSITWVAFRPLDLHAVDILGTHQTGFVHGGKHVVRGVGRLAADELGHQDDRQDNGEAAKQDVCRSEIHE